MISNTKLFAVVQDFTDGVASYIVMDMSTPSVHWNKHMAWPDGPTCSLKESTSILNSDRTRIHSLVVHGSQRLVLNTLSVSNGNLIGNTYASDSTSCTKASAMRLNKDKIYMLAECSDFHLLIYNTTNNVFTIFKSDSSVSSHYELIVMFLVLIYGTIWYEILIYWYFKNDIKAWYK